MKNIVVASWNINCGIYEAKVESNSDFLDMEKTSVFDDGCMQIIADAICEQKVDIICLQEVITTPNLGFLEMLSKKCAMPYFVSFENSDCHLVKNSRLGTAIMSKYPIELVEKKMLENPCLKKKTAKGVYTTHDKGYIIAKLTEQNLFISNAQFLPFHRFDADIEQYKSIFKDYEKEMIENKCICCGDFNCVEGVSKMKKILPNFSKKYNFVFDEVTASENKKTDNICVPKEYGVLNQKVLVKCSDHYLCVCEIKY